MNAKKLFAVLAFGQVCLFNNSTNEPDHFGHSG